MSITFSYRSVSSLRNSARRKYEARSDANARRISSSIRHLLLVYNLLLNLSLPICLYIYLYLYGPKRARAQNGDSSCACIKFLYLRRRNKFRCNMAIVICPTEGT